MEPDYSISKYIFQFLDDMWLYLLPIFLLYISRDFIANFICWFKMNHLSNKSYYSIGGQVYWNDKLQTIYNMTFNYVVLLYEENGEKKYTIIHNTAFYKAEKKFIGKF